MLELEWAMVGKKYMDYFEQAVSIREPVLVSPAIIATINKS